jgi:hypothetical protein
MSTPKFGPGARGVPTVLDGRGLKKLVKQLVEDNMRSAMYEKGLEEKEAQANTAGSLQALGGQQQKQGQDQATHSSKTMDADQEQMADGDVTPDAVIDKLNMIRSGRTLKDQEVKQKMDQYVQSLSSAERTALLAFLKGISQIVTGEVPAQQAADPADHPADVEMDKQNQTGNDQHGVNAKQKSVKPNVQKKPAGAPSRPAPKTGGVENTAAPMPIVLKRR